MDSGHRASGGARAIGIARIAVAACVIVVLVLTYAERIAVGDGNPFDYFGYFTNQTSSLTSVVLISMGVLMVSGRAVPGWLTMARGIATACLLIVGVVYNVLVPGTGSAPAWVSAILHIAFPLFVALDWLLVGDRPPLPWRRLWIVLPYPVAWLIVVIIRGMTDEWVPYGFLLPARGVPSLLAHSVGLLAALLVAGVLVWASARTSGIILRRERNSSTKAADAS